MNIDFRNHPVDFKTAISLGMFRAFGLRTHDGDTFTALIDVGFNIIFTNDIRVSGINAPEIVGTTGDVLARARAARNYLNGLTQGEPLLLDTYLAHQVMQKSFERYVARVFVTATATDRLNVGQVLLNQGLVDPLNISPV